MKPDQSPQPLSRPLAGAAIVFVLAAVLAASLIGWLEGQRQQTITAHTALEASEHAQILQRSFERSLSATYAIAALIRQGDGKVANFEAVARQLLPLYPGAAALGLAPNGILQTIVPLAGNEKAIGHNMLTDPARAKESVLARDSGEITLAGPFDLIQGGKGAVARLPVYFGESAETGQFWGFATVMLRFPEALAVAQLVRLPDQNLSYELWRIHPDTGKRQIIAASGTSALQEPVDQLIQIANASWTLSVAPTHGWGDPLGLALKMALGLLFSLLLAYLSKLLLEQRAHKAGLQALVDQRTAEIQISQRQLQATVDAIPDRLWKLDLNGVFHESHARHADSASQDWVGKNVADLFPQAVADTIMAALLEAHAFGYSNGKTYELARPEGSAWFELSVASKSIEDGQAPRFIVLERDITARKAAEGKVYRLTQLYSALSQCNQAIVRCTSEQELFTVICRDAVHFGGMKTAWIGLIDSASREVVPVASDGPDQLYVDDLHITAATDSARGLGIVGTAIRSGQPVWCQDFLSDSRTAPWHEHARRAGWASVAALPLRRGGQVIGIFCLYHGELNALDSEACALLAEMAADISFALDNFDREAARKLAETALSESQARYRAVTQFASDAIVTGDCSGKIASWNQGAEIIFGYMEAEVLGQPLTILMPQRYRERHLKGLGRLLAGTEPKLAGHTAELHGLRKDGSEFPLELSLAHWQIAEERFFTGVIRDITRRRENEAKLKLAAKVFEQSREGFTITDANRNIVLVNQAFTTITGYTEADALGQNPRLLSSGRQDKAFYRAMWEAIDTLGYWQGEVWNRRKDGVVYPEWLSISRVLDADGALANYVGIFSDISDHKAAEEQILRLGHFDPLTGLANRILLNDRVNQAISVAQRGRTQLAVLFFDLDHFKDVNDTLGHSVGDKLLVELATRLKSAVRDQDTVSRLGGDEFILVLPDTDAEGAERVATKLLETVAQAYWIDKYELSVTPSIGIAMYPGDGADYDTLFKCADAAMYRAKLGGRNHFCFFTAEMQARSARTLQLGNALRSALKRDQLELHYQPQLSVDGLRVVGAEALLRWRHPELGMISPAEFIPIAEDSGQILQIGEWVLRTAAHQCQQWIEQGLPPLTIAVNLSAVQFRQASLPRLVTQILEEARLVPRFLELELTESVAMDNPVDAIEMMDSLHERGIRMAIDDFGTGYSSLSYLKRFQVYKLKIDRSFVNEISENSEDMVIVDAIISLAKSLGMRTIAEGVETEAQLAFLREKGCDEVQGFYFSKPLPAAQFQAFVQAHDALQQARAV